MNLPAWKSVLIDMEHIASGHMQGGSRIMSGSRKDIFYNMSQVQVERAVREAYRYSSRVASQGDRVLLRGNSNSSGYVVEMWVNTSTKTIETAYPVGFLVR